jgi:hypothetical protein
MLYELLVKNKKPILKRWFDLTVDSYPADSRRFFTTNRNPFSNPVGAAISQGGERLYDLLLDGADCRSDDCCLSMDKIVRIRAVQDFSAGEAVGFVFLLKRAIREVMDRDIRKHQLFEQLSTFEGRIDELALLSFEIYMQCREKIYEIKATEIRNRTSRMLQRVCDKYGISEEC